MTKKVFILFFCLLLGANFSAFSQSRKQLEAQRKKLNTEIKQVNSLLFETQKKEKNVFANDFPTLLGFLMNDSLQIIKSEGETPDSMINGKQLTDIRALELGLIKRDTFYVSAKNSIFDETYLNSQFVL
mgnify:CR=1 FL=1